MTDEESVNDKPAVRGFCFECGKAQNVILLMNDAFLHGGIAESGFDDYLEVEMVVACEHCCHPIREDTVSRLGFVGGLW